MLKRANNKRQLKVAETIKRVMSNIVMNEKPYTKDVQINTTFITVSDVEISPCLRHVKIFVSFNLCAGKKVGVGIAVTKNDTTKDCAANSDKDVEKNNIDATICKVMHFLNKNSSFFRYRLANLVKLKFAPEITFHIDNSYESTIKIERLLQEYKGMDAEVEAADVDGKEIDIDEKD